jgi:hypothetical protein
LPPEIFVHLFPVILMFQVLVVWPLVFDCGQKDLSITMANR